MSLVMFALSLPPANGRLPLVDGCDRQTDLRLCSLTCCQNDLDVHNDQRGSSPMCPEMSDDVLQKMTMCSVHLRGK